MSERSFFKSIFFLQKPMVCPMEDASGVIIILDLVLQFNNHKRNQVFFLCICIKIEKKTVTPNWKNLSKFYFLTRSFCTPVPLSSNDQFEMTQYEMSGPFPPFFKILYIQREYDLVGSLAESKVHVHL